MDDQKFMLRVIQVVRLLLDFRTTTDASDKRIRRDVIRDIVKELTRV